MEDKNGLNSLRRGLEAIRILNVTDRLTGADLSKRLKIPRTTAHRVLETLAHEGYAIHDVANRCFRLSGKTRHLAFGFDRDALLAEIARPILKALSAETLMPVGLSTPVGTRIVTQVATDHDAPLALERVKEGAIFSLTFGASGHVFLAHCSPEARRQLLQAAAAERPSGDAQTIPTEDDFERILERGYAVSPPRAGWDEGLIAVPVYLSGNYVASVHLRFMRRVLTVAQVVLRHLPQLQDAAKAIERHTLEQVQDAQTLFTRIDGPLLVSARQDHPAA